MKYISCLSLTLILIVPSLLTAPPVQAQVDSTLYLAVDCMKSTSADYVDVEKELWKPMHQEMVNQGRKIFWALYGVQFGYRDECDYYTVNAYMGADAVQTAYADLPELFAKVHPDRDMDEASAETMASRKIVRTQLWTGVAGITPESFRYAYVNLMSAPDGNAYVDLETTVFQPIHQALVDDGLTKGWYLYSLAVPYGSTVDYNFATVDFVDRPGGLPFGEYLAKVHPDRTVDQVTEEMEATRELLLGELWYLIDRTE